ncbi:uncharacterized protein TNCV_4806291 [Trichonephila clavipes]|nr:uncharacterized protein TNCV_4806291 [Trichonephila clavipes]
MLKPCADIRVMARCRAAQRKVILCGGKGKNAFWKRHCDQSYNTSPEFPWVRSFDDVTTLQRQKDETFGITYYSMYRWDVRDHYVTISSPLLGDFSFEHHTNSLPSVIVASDADSGAAGAGFESRVNLVVRASDSRPEDLGSMLDVTKYPPSAHGFTCRNCGGGDRGRVAIYRPFGEVSLSLNRTVTCMVLKANDRRTSCPCHDEFRGPRSDYVRQVALATTTTTTLLFFFQFKLTNV